MIHKFSMKGTNIVVDVNSGAVHVFDDLSYEILDYYKKYDNEKIITMYSVVFSRNWLTGRTEALWFISEGFYIL